MNPIELSGVSKRFAKVEDIAHLSVLHRSRSSELWALRDVDLTVARGESVGILGRNGAGKTTLLSLLAGLTAPSEGHLSVQGRVAPLIGVGVGFHPELTGRENVHLNASVLGMTTSEIAARFDEIVDFSGIEAFLDAPAKTYSSGMYVRLGFAVAVCSTPDVLLVDEVLAVGDVEFVRRCFDRLAEMRLSGTTIVAVSHNLSALQVFCERGVVMDRGRVLTDSSMRDAVGRYVALVDATDDSSSAGNGSVEMELLTVDGAPATNLRSHDTIVVRLTALRPAGALSPSLRVALSTERILVWEQVFDWHRLGGGDHVSVDLVFPVPLVSGTYALSAVVQADGVELPDTGVEAGLHVTAQRVVHGTVDLQARLLP